jgi:hypothetical protein
VPWEGRASDPNGPQAVAAPMADGAGLGLWTLTLLSVPVVGWLDQLLCQAGLAELTILGAATFPLLAAVVTAATVGAVLASRGPATRWAGCDVRRQRWGAS